jgi:tape measure domain-containing protein
MRDLPLSIKLTVDGAGKVSGELAKTAGAIKPISTNAKSAATETNSLADSLKKVGQVGASFLAVSKLLQYTKALIGVADGYNNTISRLKLATSTQGEFNVAYEKLAEIAQKTAAPLAETIALYSRMAPGLKQLGANQAQLLAVSDLVGKSLALSGASTAEAAASMTQFAQAMGSGKLRGDEFNSLMEQSPRLMKAVADGIGVPIGKLREMAEAGELSAAKVVEALIKQREAVDREFASMPLTVGKALQQLENQFVRLIGETDNQTGATRSLAGAVGHLTSNLVPLVNALEPIIKIGVAFAGFKLATYLLAAATAAWTFASALVWLKTEIAVTAMAMSIGGVRGALALGASYTGLGFAATGAAGGVALLSTALKGLLIVYAGYTLGKYFYENFLSVRLATVALIDTLQRGWEVIRFGAEVMWVGIKSTWEGAINLLKGKWAEFIGFLAKGVDMVGADETAARMRAYAESYLPAKGVLENLRTAMSTAKAEHATNLRAIKLQNDAVVDLMIADDQVRTEINARAAGDLAQKLKNIAGGSDVAKKFAKEQGDLITKYMDRELDAAEELHKAMVKAYDEKIVLDRVAAEKMFADQVDNLIKLYDDRAIAESDSIDAAEDLIRKYEDETEVLGLSNKEREQAIALRELEKKGINLTADALDEYKTKLRQAVDRNAVANASAEAARDAADKWARDSQDISNSLTDALMRGFEGGANWASNFVDNLKNMFASLVLRPMIQPIAQAGAGIVTSALGLGASGVASAGGLGDVLGAGSSLLNMMAPGAISTQIGMFAGGFAEMAGATSAMAGSIGGLVATAVPWIGGLLAIGSMLGLFGGKPSNKAAYGSVDLGTGETFGLGNQTGKKQASQQTMDARTALLAGIGGYSAILSGLGGKSTGSIKTSVGERDGVQFAVNGGPMTHYGDDPNTALAKLFREMALGAEGLAEPFRTLLGYFAGAADEMASFGNGILTLSEYMDANPMQAAADAAASAGKNAWQTWQEQGTTLRTALAAWDGSAQKTAELAELTQSRYQVELQLAGQIYAALQSTHAMFASTAEEMCYSVLDQAGKYEFLRTQSGELEKALQAALDPAEIESLAKQLNDVSKSAWQLLGEEERRIKLSEYTAYLSEIDRITAERLNAAGASITAEHNADLPASITAAIESAMNRVADKMLAAAQAQQKAADTPVKFEVDVSVDQPADVEVAYS